jgi:hypothetical protein
MKRATKTKSGMQVSGPVLKEPMPGSVAFVGNWLSGIVDLRQPQ